MVQVGTWAGELEIGSDGGLPMESSAIFKDAQGKRRIMCTKIQNSGVPPSNPNVFHQKVLDVLFLRKRIETYQMGLEMDKTPICLVKKKFKNFVYIPYPIFVCRKTIMVILGVTHCL